MTDRGYYQGGPREQRYSVAEPREADPRKVAGFSPAPTSGPGRLAMGSHAHPTHLGGPGLSPNNPGKGGDSPQESYSSNRYPQS